MAGALTRTRRIERLRAEIVAMERQERACKQAVALPFGIETIDRHLPPGGLLLGAAGGGSRRRAGRGTGPASGSGGVDRPRRRRVRPRPAAIGAGSAPHRLR